MLELRTRQPGRLEVLRRLRRSAAPSGVPRIVPALRDGEPGKGDRLLLVPRSVGGAQAVSAALSSGRRHGGSRGGRRPLPPHPPPTFSPSPASTPRFRGPKQRPARPPRGPPAPELATPGRARLSRALHGHPHQNPPR